MNNFPAFIVLLNLEITIKFNIIQTLAMQSWFTEGRSDFCLDSLPFVSKGFSSSELNSAKPLPDSSIPPSEDHEQIKNAAQADAADATSISLLNANSDAPISGMRSLFMNTVSYTY